MALRLPALVRLGRPHFLPYGFVIYALGAAIAWQAGARIDASTYAWGQAFVTLAQWMVHYANDHFDQAADAANDHRTLWTGGSGVLQQGGLPQRAGLMAAAVMGLASLGPAIVLATAFGGDVVLLMAAILALSWGYSGPPARLQGRGLGPFAVALVVTGLVPALAYRLQGGPWSEPALLVLLPLVLMQAAMVVVLDFADRPADAAGGKRTLVVRIGEASARRLHGFLLVLAYLALPAAWLAGAPGLPLLVLGLTAPVAFAMMFQMRGRKGQPAWPGAATASVVLQATATVLALVAMLI